MNIAKKKVGLIHYTLKNKKGEILDSSRGRDPLAYLHGYGNLIAGLEKALEGKTIGDKLKEVVAPQDGYGLRDEKMVENVPLSNFEDADQVKAGVQFQAQSEHGVRLATVIKVVGDNVTVDFNHPLAGEELYFDIEVMGVRDANPEELSHGHVHGKGGHHH